MYLFTRRTRLGGGVGMAGIEWATTIGAKVTELTGNEVELWTNAYSPGFGTITWTAWFENLAALEAMGDQLSVEPSFSKLADEGAAFTEGGMDDAVLQPIYGAPSPERSIQYVSGTESMVAGGHFRRAMGVGVEIVEHAEKITNIPTMFVRSLTGPYGAVGWLTGYESITEMEEALAAEAADPSWLKLIDSTEGCFLEAPGATQTTIYRKLA